MNHMMPHPMIVAIASVATAEIGEACFMGRSGNVFMKSIRQPSFAPPLWAWGLIGVAYYLMCGFAMYRLMASHETNRLAIVLLVLVMTANTFWNHVYFCLRDLRLAYWYSVAYAPVAIALTVVLVLTDRIAAIGFILYVAYLPYALTLSYRTWKMNEREGI